MTDIEPTASIPQTASAGTRDKPTLAGYSIFADVCESDRGSRTATPLEQLEALHTLRPNWDGYNADPPDPQVLEWAKGFIPVVGAHAVGGVVQVYPVRTGGVQFEWDDGSFEHELEFNPDGSQGLLHVEKATGAMREERFAPGRALSPLNLFAN